MKLKRELPQFKNTPSLVIVTGWQVAKIFYANNGEIHQEKEIEIENPQYTEKEGSFESKGGGMAGVVRSSASAEKDKKYVRAEFLKEFNQYLNERIKKGDIKDVYVFSPSQGLSDLKDHMSSGLKDMVKGFLVGNYTNKKPDELVEMIKKEQESKSIDIMTEEAKKILDKSSNF